MMSVHHNKNIKFFNEDFVDLALETGWCLGKPKEHNLILEVVIFDAKSSFLLVIFSDSHSIIGTS